MNGSDNDATSVKSPAYVKSFARKRLAAILDADKYALILTNRRARRGVRQPGFSR